MYEMGSNDRAFLRTARQVSGRRTSVRIVDLFSGCGGMTLGVEEAARRIGRTLDVRLAVEQDHDIASTYAKNFSPAQGEGRQLAESWFGKLPARPLSFAERRTRKLVGDVDVLVGGPPCQGHSTLNNYTRGDDPKNTLYSLMARATQVLEPECVIIENVPAVERDSRGTVDRTVEHLLRSGYLVDVGIVCVSEIGVPQMRRRHVVIAHRESQPSIETALDFARVSRPRNLRWAIRDLLSKEGCSPFDMPSLMSPENIRRANFLLKKKIFDLPNAMRPPCQQTAHKYKSMYGRLSWDAPAQTITTGFGSPGQGRYIHPERPRTLTPHEAARIQFFPDWFDFSPLKGRKAVAEAIGNAVPSKLSFVLSSHLIGLKAHRASAL